MRGKEILLCKEIKITTTATSTATATATTAATTTTTIHWTYIAPNQDRSVPALGT